jgi:hypothetical protein
MQHSNQTNPFLAGSPAPPVEGSPVPTLAGSPAPPVEGSPVPTLASNPTSPVAGNPVPPVAGSPVPPVAGNPVPPVAGNPMPVDALALWGAGAGSGSIPAPQLVELDGNERILIPFTIQIVLVTLHYLKFNSHRGYTRCGGMGCLLCALNQDRSDRHLLPVYDPLARSILLLPVSPTMRPGALAPQLAPALEELRSGRRVMLRIRKSNRTDFHVEIDTLPPIADDGASKIRPFLAVCTAGTVDLLSVYSFLTGDQLKQIPEIATMLSFRKLEL